jgi:predicted dinucleotide-binding enzyme
VWQAEERVFEGRQLVVPLCGDDADALAQVEELVRDLKAEPVRAGG